MASFRNLFKYDAPTTAIPVSDPPPFYCLAPETPAPAPAPPSSSLSLAERIENALFPPDLLREARERSPVAFNKAFTAEEWKRQHFGISGTDARSVQARGVASQYGSSVVGVSVKSRSGEDNEDIKGCSGIVIQNNDYGAFILTSAHIIASAKGDVDVYVHLPSGEGLSAIVRHCDFYHNVAMIEVEDSSQELKAVELSRDVTVEIGSEVVAIGRHFVTSRLLATVGEISARDDDLEYEDLMSSTCTISEYGLGGPLVDMTSGLVLGMNFGSVTSCPFIPAALLTIFMHQFKTSRRIIRPWIGLKTRAIKELDLDELEVVHRKFQSLEGIIVRKVEERSPADYAGICEGDIITCCEGTHVNHPVEFTYTLCKHTGFDDLSPVEARERAKKARRTKRKGKSMIEVGIRRRNGGLMENVIVAPECFSPPDKNIWPVTLYKSGLFWM